MADELGDIIERLTDETTHRDRPFTGQRHTASGERGKTEVCHIRFRDLSDCAARAFVCSMGYTGDHPLFKLRHRAADGTLNYNDLYLLALSEIDPQAFIQNLCVEVEKAMGIYPNVPSLKAEEQADE